MSLNVTAVGPQSDGFATVFPCGGAVPTASNLNYRAGDVVPNAVITDLDDSGKVCVYTFAATHLIVDVNGAFPTQSAFRAPAAGAPLRLSFRELDDRRCW